jgi:hypothetical protein
MEYQHPPIPIQRFCIRQESESAIPGIYFMAFNDDSTQSFDEDAYRFLSVIVPKCEKGWLDIPYE